MRTARLSAAMVACALLTGCEGIQSILHPTGPQAQRIAGLWWTMLAVYSAVLIAVSALALIAVLRGRRRREDASLSHRQQRNLVLMGGAIVPAVVLLGFLVYSAAVSRAMVAEPPDALQIEVVGHQWWWHVHYPMRQPNLSVSTANEIHIPAGRPVSIHLKSRDVIHSFWVPNLHGKTDLVPGHVNRTWIQADTPGVWRGQCGEYCGLQHAHMAFLVIAHAPADFDRWLEAQRQPAKTPPDETAARGREVFLNGSCVLCHSVRGTIARSAFGPDLTHLASRRTLASGTTPNTRGHLAGWILDPQVIKPGTRMPANHLDHHDLHALLAYLESLE
jgi:cytochrome c oxidase subunit II